MHAGIPLTDADRMPWLDRLNHALHDHAATGAVLACSALTDDYRARLTAGLDRSAIRAPDRRPRAHPSSGSSLGTATLRAPTCSPRSSTRSRLRPTRSPSTSLATRDRGRAQRALDALRPQFRPEKLRDGGTYSS